MVQKSRNQTVEVGSLPIHYVEGVVHLRWLAEFLPPRIFASWNQKKAGMKIMKRLTAYGVFIINVL